MPSAAAEPAAGGVRRGVGFVQDSAPRRMRHVGTRRRRGPRGLHPRPARAPTGTTSARGRARCGRGGGAPAPTGRRSATRASAVSASRCRPFRGREPHSTPHRGGVHCSDPPPGLHYTSSELCRPSSFVAVGNCGGEANLRSWGVGAALCVPDHVLTQRGSPGTDRIDDLDDRVGPGWSVRARRCKGLGPGVRPSAGCVRSPSVRCRERWEVHRDRLGRVDNLFSDLAPKPG